MIITFLISIGMSFVTFLLLIFSNLISNFPSISVDKISGITYFLNVANSLLPQGFLYSFLSCVAFWLFVQMSWAIIVFIYGKLPFINLH